MASAVVGVLYGPPPPGVDLLGNLPGCVCRKVRKMVLFRPEMRELRDPQNGC